MQFEQAASFILNKLRNQLPAHLTYHSIEHVEDVYQAAQNIGRLEGISNDEMNLLLTAALFHDTGYLVKGKGHEEESCRIVREYLPAYSYTADEIEQVCAMIMATRIPQTPQSHLGQILADADLDYLGRDDFFTISHKLYKELLSSGLVNNECGWNNLQIDFMQKHRYFTKTALNLRETKKQSNIQHIKTLI